MPVRGASSVLPSGQRWVDSDIWGEVSVFLGDCCDGRGLIEISSVYYARGEFMCGSQLS